MSNTTASAGYLTPISAPVDRAAFQDAVQAMVVGVTGLPGPMVRPRYQAKPPRRPDLDKDWCAIGDTNTVSSRSRVRHVGEGDGRGEVVTELTLEVLASFYGPGSQGWAARLRDGLMLTQNRAALRAASITVAEIGRALNVPEMVSGEWVARVDLPLTVQWETRQTFGVLTLVAAGGELVTDTGLTRTITIKP